jgi:general secretion pathway protein F
MAVFSYKAVDNKGRKHTGMLEVDNARQLRQQLRTRGWIALSVLETKAHHLSLPAALRRSKAVFANKQLTLFTRELSILLEGGLPLERALKLIAMQMQNLKVRERILALHGQIVEGVSFARSMEAYPDDFPPLYCATVEAGERAGDLAGVLGRLADYGETHLRTMTKVKLAMLYPCILSVFSCAVVAGLLTYVFPDIARIFVQSGTALPWITRAMMALSDGLRRWGLLMLIAIPLVVAALRHILANPKAVLLLHRNLLALPVAGRLVMSVDIARFTATLSMLSSSGVPLAEALKISCKVISNRWLRKAGDAATVRVIEGSSLSQALTQTKCFSPAFISIIAGGEASGELDRVLGLAARNQMRELENNMLFGVAILEPAIILSMGLMVLLVVLAIMMPILSINQLVK